MADASFLPFYSTTLLLARPPRIQIFLAVAESILRPGSPFLLVRAAVDLPIALFDSRPSRSNFDSAICKRHPSIQLLLLTTGRNHVRLAAVIALSLS